VNGDERGVLGKATDTKLNIGPIKLPGGPE
jgi:hypothetical protein